MTNEKLNARNRILIGELNTLKIIINTSGMELTIIAPFKFKVNNKPVTIRIVKSDNNLFLENKLPNKSDIITSVFFTIQKC